MEKDKLRYIENKFPSKPTDTLSIDVLREQVADIFVKDLSVFLQKIKPDEKRGICSVINKSSPDLATFDGAGGFLSLYIELIGFMKDLETLNDGEKEGIKGIIGAHKGSEYLNVDELLLRAKTSFESLAALIKAYEKSDKTIQVSYYFGATSIYYNGCMLSYYNNDKKSFHKYLAEILSYKKLIQSKRKDYYKEILYGVAGYLYILVSLQSKFSNPSNKDFEISIGSDVRDLLELILEDGLEKWGDIDLKNPPKDFRLYYTFHDREYFGGAHGLFGVLHIMMIAYNLNREFLEKETDSFADALKVCIRLSLQNLLKYQLPSGNFPTSEKRKNDDSLVQFCHGTPGIVPVLLNAAEFFKNEQVGEDCMKAALKGGENIWKFGILKKGYGLCHGCSGNAYALLKLYKITQDSVWLFRGLCFLSIKNDKYYTDIIDNYEFEDRNVVGKSDYPYSLLLGLAGDIIAEFGALSITSLR